MKNKTTEGNRQKGYGYLQITTDKTRAEGQRRSANGSTNTPETGQQSWLRNTLGCLFLSVRA